MASGDLIAHLDARFFWQGTANEGGWTTVEGPGGTKHLVMKFATSIIQRMRTTIVLPSHYSGGAITTHISYAMATAVPPAQVVWRADMRAEVGRNIFIYDGSLHTGVEQLFVVPTNNLEVVTVQVENTSIAGQIAYGDIMHLRLNRWGSHADDNAAGDAYIYTVALYET